MKRYVVGFMFDGELKRVLLINRPIKNGFSSGYNGLGGRIEKGETPKEAMCREFLEEASKYYDDWLQVGRMSGKDWECFIFFGCTTWWPCYRVIDEGQLGWHSLDNLPENTQDFTNIPWLIAMVKDPNVVEGKVTIEVEYK